MAHTINSSPINRATVAAIGTALLARLDWIGSDLPWLNRPSSTTSIASPTTTTTLRHLDYACGTGALLLPLARHVSSAVGIDVSPAMISIVRERLSALTQSDHARVPEGKVKLFVGDLLSGEEEDGGEGKGVEGLSEDEGSGFDVVSVGLALHHFEKPGEAVRRLVGRLNEGGVLVVTELVMGEGDEPPAEGEGHSHSHGHGRGADMPKHNWINEADLKTMFTEAGLVDVDTDRMEQDYLFEMGDPPRVIEKKMYFGKGRKPAAKSS